MKISRTFSLPLELIKKVTEDATIRGILESQVLCEALCLYYAIDQRLFTFQKGSKATKAARDYKLVNATLDQEGRRSAAKYGRMIRDTIKKNNGGSYPTLEELNKTKIPRLTAEEWEQQKHEWDALGEGEGSY